MTVCLKQRKHVTLTQNIGKMVKKTNYDAYTIGNVYTYTRLICTIMSYQASHIIFVYNALSTQNFLESM